MLEITLKPVCSTHPLAAKSTITLSALARHLLISLPPGTGLRSCLDAACAAGRLNPTISFEAGDPRMLAELASHGLGVAIVPTSITEAWRDDLHALQIIRPVLCGRVALAWPPGGPTNPAARVLIRRAQAATA
jgi:DNA-binding transcriptional LysR family regulator